MAKKKAEAKKSGKQVSQSDFIKAVQGSETLDEAVAKIGNTKASVQQRMTTMRSEGIPLKTFGRQSNAATRVAEARELLAKLTGQSEADVAQAGDELIEKVKARKAKKATK